MKLIAIGVHLEDNAAFADNPFCQESLQMTIDFFQKVGEENYSTRILRKNGFKMTGQVIDPEDGEVWEWAFEK